MSLAKPAHAADLSWAADARGCEKARKENGMFIGLFVILLILWIAGMVAGFVIKGFIHILLVIAIIALVLHFVRGRKGKTL